MFFLKKIKSREKKANLPCFMFWITWWLAAIAKNNLSPISVNRNCFWNIKCSDREANHNEFIWKVPWCIWLFELLNRFHESLEQADLKYWQRYAGMYKMPLYIFLNIPARCLYTHILLKSILLILYLHACALVHY